MRIEIIEKQVFKFDELSDLAKESALNFFRDSIELCDYAEAVYEDCERVAEILGIVFDRKRVPLMNGKIRTEPAIEFSGFWNQGDGARFTGAYSYRRGAAKLIREYAPKDETLHAIADKLQSAQRPFFYKVNARITARHSHYVHENTVSIDCDHDDSSAIDVSSAESVIDEALRDFMRWIYRSLEGEYDYQTSAETIKETISANEYEFDANGRIH